MIECLILGDSIAVGTHQYRPECELIATNGINSHQWNKQNASRTLSATTTIISLGSNDHPGVRSLWELQQLRTKVVAQRVYWILPANNKDIQQMIQLIAQDYGDTVLPISRLQKDGVHPSWAGYRQLARQAQ